MLIRTMQELEAQGRVISISHGKTTAVRLLTKADGHRQPGPATAPRGPPRRLVDDTRPGRWGLTS